MITSSPFDELAEVPALVNSTGTELGILRGWSEVAVFDTLAEVPPLVDGIGFGVDTITYKKFFY